MSLLSLSSTPLPITTLTASFLGLMIVITSYRCAMARKKFKVEIGDGENKELSRRIRVHGNLVEYAPMALLLMGLLELNQPSQVHLSLFAVAFVIGRLLHAYGFGNTPGISFGRFYGMLLTFISMTGMALFNLYFVIIG